MDDSTRGRHLIVTGFTLSETAALLDNPEALADLLTDVVAAAHMVVLDPPKMVRVPLNPEKANSEEDCGGVTGTVILSTSHASIHTWPLHARFSFDLYSCHDFDAREVLGVLCDRLKATGGKVVNLDRTPDPNLRDQFKLVSM